MPTARPRVCGRVSIFYGAVSGRSHFTVIKFSELEIKCFKYFNKGTTNLRFFSVPFIVILGVFACALLSL